MNLMFLAAVTAAVSSASVELKAVMDWAFDWHKTVPPPQVTACPVVDRLLVGLFPCAASTKQIDLDSVVSEGHTGSDSSVVGVIGMGLSGESSLAPFLWKMIPQSLVVRRHLAMDFGQWWWNFDGLDPCFDIRVMAHPVSGLQLT